MKAVIYARYSCSNQREESIEGQIRECQAYADRYGYIVVDTYIDRAKTGRKDTRPAFQKRSRQLTVEDEYILTTRLYCGECGRTMIGESGTSGTNGVIHRYYKCTGVKRHLGCTKKTVKKDWIEDIVLEQIMKVLFNEELLNKVADEVLKSFDKENTLLPVLYNEKKDIDNGIKNFLDAIQQGIITESTKERLVELEAKRKELECEIAKVEAAKPVITKEHIMCWFENLKNYNIKNATHRRRLVDVFINAIYLFDDKIILVFNFKNNTKRTKKEEIQKSPLSSAPNNCCAPKRNDHQKVVVFFLLFNLISVCDTVIRQTRRLLTD